MLVKHGAQTGITYGRLLPGVVPLYEELEACREAGYHYRLWRSLDSDERALHVAHYRLRRLVELHANDAVSDKMESEIAKRQARSATRRR